MGHPFQAINITPRQDQVGQTLFRASSHLNLQLLQIIRRGMLEKWDYCLRHLFVLKSKSLKSAIAYVH